MYLHGRQLWGSVHSVHEAVKMFECIRSIPSSVPTCDIWMPTSGVDSLQGRELMKKLLLVHQFLVNLTHAGKLCSQAQSQKRLTRLVKLMER